MSAVTAAPLVEICVDDVAGALAAEAEGADRIELCSAMSEGGLTPSFGLVQAVFGRVRRIGVRIMIRPRGGNYVFSAEEVEVMCADIAAFRALPRAPGVAVGFVCGALTAEGGAETLAILVGRAAGRVTIIAGGGVRARNVRALLERTGVPEVHLRAMRPDAFGRQVTSTEEIAAFIRAVRQAA